MACNNGARASEGAVRKLDTETQLEVSDQKEDSEPNEPAYSKERGMLSKADGVAPAPVVSSAAQTRAKR